MAKSSNIRPMVRADIEPVAELVLATPLWQRHGVQRAQFTARLEHALNDAATILVATRPGEDSDPAQIAGFIWYAARGAFGRSGYITLLGVAPSRRQQGIGGSLLARAESALFTATPDIFLLVSDFNEAGQQFYQRAGYAQIGVIPDYVTPGIAELIYHKRCAT